MKIIKKIIVKTVFSSFMLYSYNLIAVEFNLIIPINIFTIMFVGILGIPSVFALALFKIFIL